MCEVYLKLQAWDDLEKLVNESLEIHQQHVVSLDVFRVWYSKLTKNSLSWLSSVRYIKSNENTNKQKKRTEKESLIFVSP